MLMTATRDPAQLGKIKAACRFLEEAEKPTLSEVAEHVGLSPWHLQRLFTKLVGVSPKSYAEQRRAERFRRELKSGESVAGATYGAGYGSSSRVYEKAGKRFGMTPASYAKGGKGAAIAYSIAPSPLGSLLVAATEKGVCFVGVHDSERTLEKTLRDDFPAAQIARDDRRLKPAIDAVVEFLKSGGPHPNLPLDVRATAFQRRVWEELLAIPPGETRSYSDMAEILGLPKGQRAVGGACASNPVALLIPCHRVTRDDGTLGGYRWGLKRKEKLLAVEAARAPSL